MSEAPQGFRNTDRLTQWARFLLYAQAAAGLVVIAATYLQHRILAQMQAHAGPMAALQTALRANTIHRLDAFGLYVLVYLFATIVLMRWVYLANANARSLGARGMRFTPGWSVGWFFIPIANLWKPYQVMKEIWRASHDPAHWQSAETGPLLVPWWSFQIVNAVIGLLALPFVIHVPHNIRLLRLSLLDQVTYALVIGFLLMTTVLIQAIARAQRQTHANQGIAA